MPRPQRTNIGCYVYHVLNRANARVQIFDNYKDYMLLENILEEAKEKLDMRILSYCIMPNHWHLALYPKKDGDLSKFMSWVTNTHTRRWHTIKETIGQGHLYQGRYKSFLVQEDEHLLQLFKYIESNPLRARLVEKAEDWEWSSLSRKEKGNDKQKKLLDEWPINVPRDYIDLVNIPQINTELESLRYSLNKGKPYGSESWVNRMMRYLQKKNNFIP